LRVIYLDHNATTPPSAGVVEAVHRTLTETWANPSSVHRAGQAARAQVELARKEVAVLVGATPREIVFTSGGTEAIDLAIRGVIGAAKRSATDPPTVVSSRVEHAAVRDLLESLAKRGEVAVRWSPVDRAGVVVVEDLAPLLQDAALAVFQWVNNETGVVQPVARLGALCRERRVHFHCDAVQCVGKEPVDVSAAPFDSLSIAAHKFHGPKGIGALWVRGGAGLAPTMHGAQELGRRGGTENVPGIAGMGVACREAAAWLADPAPRERLVALRDRFERTVLKQVPTAVINSAGAPRLWNTTNIAFPPLEAEALLLMLSERGVCASAGAACSSGSLEPSPVLLAMGIPEPIAHGSLRFSLGKDTTFDEIDEAGAVVAACARRLADRA
jgi:cysteine desulfurase